LKKIRLNKLDEKTLLLKLPLLGTVEAEEPKEYRGIFVKDISEAIKTKTERIELRCHYQA
jgi:hypothetical protein